MIYGKEFPSAFPTWILILVFNLLFRHFQHLELSLQNPHPLIIFTTTGDTYLLQHLLLLPKFFFLEKK